MSAKFQFGRRFVSYAEARHVCIQYYMDKGRSYEECAGSISSDESEIRRVYTIIMEEKAAEARRESLLNPPKERVIDLLAITPHEVKNG